MARAKNLIRAVATAGVQAAKFIVTDPRRLTTRPQEPFTYATAAGPRTRPIGDVLAETVFTPTQWREIRDYCRDLGVVFYATTDYEAGIDLLESLDVPAHKVCAWDIRHLPLIRAMASTRKPVLVDIGTATEQEYVEALEAAGPLAFPVHAPHPTKTSDWNMARIQPGWGFSSPEREIWCDFTALGLGAWLVEKRLTLQRNDLTGHHHVQSLDPEEFRDWARAIFAAALALREPAYGPGTAHAATERVRWGRSLVAARPLRPGERITLPAVTAKRPAGGICPSQVELVVGRLVRQALDTDEVLQWEHLE